MVLNNEIHVKLGELSPGECVEITGFCVEDDLQRFLHRLYEVGFLVGEKIQILGHAPLSRNPMSIKVKDATYALRREDANLIRVKKLAPAT